MATNEEMILSIATSLGHIGSRLDQVEANIMTKVETEIRLIKSEFSHLEEKFHTEVLRGDKLYQLGLEKLETHEEQDNARFERHTTTTAEQIDKLFGKTRVLEERQHTLEEKIHTLEIKPAIEAFEAQKERKGEAWKVAIAVAVTGALAVLWDVIRTALNKGAN